MKGSQYFYAIRLIVGYGRLIAGKMPSFPFSFLIIMNNYDSKHLRVLDLISLNLWAEMNAEDLYELKVLIACKYVRVDMRIGRIPTVQLNPEGHHYHQRLSAMAAIPRPITAHGRAEAVILNHSNA